MPVPLLPEDTSAVFDVPAAPVLVPVLVVALTVSTVVLHRRGRLSAARLLTAWAGCAYLAAVAALTLLPLQVALGEYANQAAWYAKVNWVPILTIDPRTFALNVVMTVPLGVFASLVLGVGDKRRAALVGLVLSATIELAQGLTNVFLSSGRLADVNDLVANTVGCVLGFVVLRALRRHPRFDALARRMTLIGPDRKKGEGVRRRNSTPGPAVVASHERLPG